MAIVDLTSMTALSTWSDDDLIYVVDDPSGSPLPRKMTLANLMQKAWGQIGVDEGSTTQALTAATFAKVSQFDENGQSKNTTPDHANDKITITNAGLYVVAFSLSATTGAAADLDAAIYWNGSITKIRGEATSASGTAIVCVSASGVLNVTTGATDLELWARSSVTNSLGVTQGVLSCYRIG